MAGKTYLILGKASGWSMYTNLSEADASFIGENSGDFSGYSVAGAGDVNNDEYDDILIGAHYNEDGDIMAGKTYLILGKASGWSMDIDLSNADASFLGEGLWDTSGCSVAGAGDVNSDGYDDILIGASNNDDGSGQAGQTYIVLSSKDFLITPESDSPFIIPLILGVTVLIVVMAVLVSILYFRE